MENCDTKWQSMFDPTSMKSFRTRTLLKKAQSSGLSTRFLRMVKKISIGKSMKTMFLSCVHRAKKPSWRIFIHTFTRKPRPNMDVPISYTDPFPRVAPAEIPAGDYPSAYTCPL